jgi:hypothetical protein
VGEGALLHSLELHGKVREACRGLWKVPLFQGHGGVIMAEGEQVGGRINCPNPRRDVTLSLKHKRKALLG